jgi:hypothetical protein
MYQPKYPPLNPDAAALASYVNDELQSVAQASSDARDYLLLNVLYAEPKKPRNGMVALASGVGGWNPGGTGAGIYARIAGAWVKL